MMYYFHKLFFHVPKINLVFQSIGITAEKKKSAPEEEWAAAIPLLESSPPINSLGTQLCAL